ncbi:MAG: hypothetical protein ACO2ZI_06595 [Paracoccaceae bacterium]|nr:hypothetical protein [Rhodobacterales bacterium LSUCC0374]
MPQYPGIISHGPLSAGLVLGAAIEGEMSNLISALIRMVIRRMVSRGVNNATDHVARRGARGDPAQARATERRLRQTTGLMRRFMRF